MGADANSSIWITGKKSKEHTHQLRSEVDAILIGRNTAEIDNPSLTVREVAGNNPIRIVADTYRKLPLNLKLFNDQLAENIVLCSMDKFKKSVTSNCTYLPVKDKNGFLDEESILNTLGNYGINLLLIEGGKDLITSFLSKNLIDEVIYNLYNL